MIFNSQDRDGNFYSFGRAPNNSGALLVCGDERNHPMATLIASDRQRSRNRLFPNPHSSISGQTKTPTRKGEGLLSAETRGFEPPKDLTPYLISSEAHSTGLCDVSSNL
jgi:hypothetical protein